MSNMATRTPRPSYSGCSCGIAALRKQLYFSAFNKTSYCSHRHTRLCSKLSLHAPAVLRLGCTCRKSCAPISAFGMDAANCSEMADLGCMLVLSRFDGTSFTCCRTVGPRLIAGIRGKPDAAAPSSCRSKQLCKRLVCNAQPDSCNRIEVLWCRDVHHALHGAKALLAACPAAKTTP